MVFTFASGRWWCRLNFRITNREGRVVCLPLLAEGELIDRGVGESRGSNENTKSKISVARSRILFSAPLEIGNAIFSEKLNTKNMYQPQTRRCCGCVYLWFRDKIDVGYISSPRRIAPSVRDTSLHGHQRRRQRRNSTGALILRAKLYFLIIKQRSHRKYTLFFHKKRATGH